MEIWRMIKSKEGHVNEENLEYMVATWKKKNQIQTSHYTQYSLKCIKVLNVTTKPFCAIRKHE